MNPGHRRIVNLKGSRTLKDVLQQQISAYDALLHRIAEVRLEVQRYRDVAHKSMASYSSALVPIRRLPSEILRSVFRDVQTSLWNTDSEPWHEDDYDNEAWGSLPDLEVLDFSRGPWKLGHICEAWRGIILSYPRLWSHILLRFWASPLDQALRCTIPALQTMLLHSAQHSLDIIFEFRGGGHEDAAVQAFSVILEESYRWRSMDLQISLTLLGRLRGVRGKLPCLESLTVKTSHIPSSSREELPEDV
ncbi:hypothetical protein F5146DRAFT_1120657 [Armillaria mellea]|nr:hypothetical protein F5146DRAFT_1120657 [Armillaria mellea]